MSLVSKFMIFGSLLRPFKRWEAIPLLIPFARGTTESAALEPRHLGVRVVIVKSFVRIFMKQISVAVKDGISGSEVHRFDLN